MESELRRRAVLDQFCFRFVIPPEVPRARVEQMASEVRAWFVPDGGPLKDSGANVTVLFAADVARQLPLQETWISEGLKNVPVPPVLPAILEVRSARALVDPVMARDIMQGLKELHPQGLVVHEQLALDATLTAHRTERGIEGRTALVANGALALGILWLAIAWWSLQRRARPGPDVI
jgi:hypothetical protein